MAFQWLAPGNLRPWSIDACDALTGRRIRKMQPKGEDLVKAMGGTGV